MKDVSMPIRVVGPGSQPDDGTLQYLEMPRGMATFRMPVVPDGAAPDALATTRDLLAGFLAAFAAWDPAAERHGPQLAVPDLPAPVLKLVNEMLGEGEVAIQISGVPSFKIQESVFTGIWRVCRFDGNGRPAGDWIEAGALPRVVLDAAQAAGAAALPPVAIPPGAMNSPALLHEIGARLREQAAGGASDAAHVINLTLFPLTPDDRTVLDAALPPGPVAIMSRGFGNCRIGSTLARDVWHVQYFNNMNTLILDTIEIVAVPEVAQAAVEDLEDSRTRLAELVEWIGESCAESGGAPRAE